MTRASAAALLGGSLLFAVLAAWTWGRWPDVQVDYGRELYTAWRLSQGDVLYRDVAYFNGPLSPYWNALLFRIFGAGFWVLAGANLAILAGLAFLLHQLLSLASNRVGAAVGTAVLLAVFAFGHLYFYGNYNYVCPYSHELTHGLLLSLASCACLARVGGAGGMRWAAATGFLLGTVLLTKPEVFLAIAVAITVGAALLGRRTGSGGGGAGRTLAVVLGTALVPPVLATGLLTDALPVADAVRGILGAWPSLWAGDVTSIAFYRSAMGIDAPAANLKALLITSLAWLAVLVPAAVIDRFAAGRSRRVGVTLGVLAFLGVLAALSALPLDWLEAARPLPLVMLVAFASTASALRRGHDRSGAAMRLVLVLFALLLLAKMILNARVQHYGFALAMPAGCLAAALGAGRLPGWLEARGGDGRIFRGAILGALAALAFGYGRISHAFYDGVAGNPTQLGKRFSVGTGSDRFVTDARGPYVQVALREIERRSRPGESVLVLPEGVMLNYLSRRASPTPYVNFMPPEIVMFGEAEIIAALEAAPPVLVLYVHKSTEEYGLPFFGRHYARALDAWIRERYLPVGEPIGQPPLEPGTVFGISVLKLRGRR